MLTSILRRTAGGRGGGFVDRHAGEDERFFSFPLGYMMTVRIGVLNRIQEYEGMIYFRASCLIAIKTRALCFTKTLRYRAHVTNGAVVYGTQYAHIQVGYKCTTESTHRQRMVNQHSLTPRSSSSSISSTVPARRVRLAPAATAATCALVIPSSISTEWNPSHHASRVASYYCTTNKHTRTK